MVKRKVARRGFEMKWIAGVIAGSALLAQGGLATAKESALPPRECAAKAQAAAMKLRDMASAIEAEAAYAERHGGAFSPELTQEFVQWYRAQSAKAGSELPDLGKTDLTVDEARARQARSDAHQSGLQSLMRTPVDVFSLTKKKNKTQ